MKTIHQKPFPTLKTIFFLFILGGFSSAQSINTLSIAYYRYQGNVDFSNYDLTWVTSIIGDVHLGSYLLKDTEFLFTVNNSRSIYEGALYTHDAKVVLKTDLFAHKTFSPFMMADWEFDSTLALDYRTNFGFGGKYTLFGGISISYAALWEWEKYRGEEEKSFFRHSIRPKYKQKFGDALTFVWQVYYQPALDWSNYLVNNEATLSLKTLIDRLSVDLKYRDKYNSQPLATYQHRDTYYSVGITLEL